MRCITGITGVAIVTSSTSRRKGAPSLLPTIDIAALLEDREEDLRTEQINVMHASVMELLGDPGSLLYAKPHSMTEHFDALVVGAHAIGDLPSHGRCRDNDATAQVHKEEAAQVRQKILRCLDMRVVDGDLVVPTCLRTPTLILPVGHFMQLYYNPDNQGQYASLFSVGGQGFLQPGRDIRMDIVPRGFRQLPDDVLEFIDRYFHRQETEDRMDAEEEESMSTDTEPLKLSAD